MSRTVKAAPVAKNREAEVEVDERKWAPKHVLRGKSRYADFLTNDEYEWMMGYSRPAI